MVMSLSLAILAYCDFLQSRLIAALYEIAKYN